MQTVVRVAPYVPLPIRAPWVRVPACVQRGSLVVGRRVLICKPVPPTVGCVAARVLPAPRVLRVLVRP
jgi:hypothetical protein